MSYYVVQGGQTLRGSVPISGAKNSVLPILAATLLNGGRNVLHNCPDLRDVRSAIQILEHLGCKVSREGATVTVDSTVVDRWDVPHELMREMRSSVIFLGPFWPAAAERGSACPAAATSVSGPLTCICRLCASLAR